MSNEAIARAWMASPHWGRWRVGMVSLHGLCCVRVADSPRWYDMDDDTDEVEGRLVFEVAHLNLQKPDLSHPGTRAFLLEDVRTAHGDPFVQIVSERDQTQIGGWGHRVIGNDADWLGPWLTSEHEALLAALLAAPGGIEAVKEVLGEKGG